LKQSNLRIYEFCAKWADKMALARICWIEAKDGGRRTPFTGTRYITVARFEREKAKWPKEAWSLVVDFGELPTRSCCVTADVHFLVPEAPEYLLTTGDKFELFEGNRCVAEGEIISSQREADRSLSA
jgi:hypothetical protein